MSGSVDDFHRLNGLAAEASLPKNLDLSEAKRVMVFAPHPDDECIGCGGALAMLAQKTHVAVCVVLVTNGDGGANAPFPNMGAMRVEEFRSALQLLGVSDFRMMNRMDGRFVLDSDFVKEAAILLESFNPNWILLPGPLDYHKDHLLVSKGVQSACAQIQSIEQLVFYETWTPLPATHVLDITSVMELKCQALREHGTALKYGDYERGVKGLNAYRGLYLGFNRFAEAFVVNKLSKVGGNHSLVAKLTVLGLSLKRLLGH